MAEVGIYETLDPRFSSLVTSLEKMETLYTGCRFAEGPVYFAAGRYFLWSDIPNDRMLRYDETDGSVSVFRQSSNHANGNTIDRTGRLVTCEHATRRVTRTEYDGKITVLTDNWNGKRFNSPNDVVVRSDGSIWFTDPPYGIDNDYHGNRSESEIGASYVYRIDPHSGKVDTVITDMIRPNGLAFSPDESKLYVVESGRTHSPNDPANIRVFNVRDNGVSGGRVFADSTNGIFDGLRVDTDGHVWVSAGDGVHTYDVGGNLLGKILTPEAVGNLEFGGPKKNALYITATSSLYSIRVMVNGAKSC